MMMHCLLNLRVFILVLVTMGLQWLVFYHLFADLLFDVLRPLTYAYCLQFVFNMEQGLPVLPEWLFFNRVNARARKGVEIGPACLLLRYASLFGIFFLRRK